MIKIMLVVALAFGGFFIWHVSEKGMPFKALHKKEKVLPPPDRVATPSEALKQSVEKPKPKTTWRVPARREVLAVVCYSGRTFVQVEGEAGFIGVGDWWGEDFILGIFAKGAKIRTPDGSISVVRFTFPAPPKQSLDAYPSMTQPSDVNLSANL
jgi:hypothetical protein